MKSFMIFINALILMLIALTVFVHLVHQKPEPDAILGLTPSAPSNSVQNPLPLPIKTPASDSFIKKNLFDPMRGKKPETPPASAEKPKKDNLELVGTFKYGSKVGAIIKDTAPSKKGSDKTDKKTEKRVFYLNEIMPNGCLVKTIEKDKVTLEQNGTEFEIVIDLNDSASQKRITSVPKLKETPTLIATGPPAAKPTAPPGAAAALPAQKPGTVAPPMPPKPGEEEDLAAIGAPIPTNMGNPPQPNAGDPAANQKKGRRLK